ncbi:N5-glutamine methyltransferase family protein [Brevibacterium aurantiacum]|uniref:N5-glutamine methyltransferase family protein n=1 Tax=Brevibacterium aurantiacum TaxID=273384 RepID=UPI0018692D7E|nr:HemK family protein methyltransferase [Brevibacterium aurantiacum]
MSRTTITAHLREAGCVFAEDEARILLEAAQEAASSDFGDRHSVLGRLLARRVAGEPLEQIVGWVDFAGQRIAVAPGVFVPRQRTTLLAQQSLLAVQTAGESARFLEAFCGVGAVATTVSRAFHGTEIHLGDHDESALGAARANVGAQATPHLLDCLVGLPQSLSGRFDVISAVPPYVPDSAAQYLPHEAAEYEPATALFGGADGLDLVRRLITESHDWLAPGGVLLIELGSQQQQPATDFAEALGFIGTRTLGEDEQTVVLELRLRS